MAYAAASDLFARKDKNTIADLVADEGQRPNRIELASHAVITAALDDASGAIDASLLAGKRYTTADLDGLTGNSLAHLKRICCDIAMAYLFERRQSFNPDEHEKHRKLAQVWLDKLASGEDVFNVAANLNAGLTSVDGPTTVDMERLNTIEVRASRYYPGVAGRLPTNRG